jgi:hypothetical protein
MLNAGAPDGSRVESVAKPHHSAEAQQAMRNVA